MKQVLEEFFHKLSYEWGEDIFEYGFGSGEEEYLKYLLTKEILTVEEYNELIEDGAELFQVINSVDEDNYDKCLSTFAEYVAETFTAEQVADLLIAFHNGR